MHKPMEEREREFRPIGLLGFPFIFLYLISKAANHGVLVVEVVFSRI